MKEKIKRATNNANKDDLLELLSTISQLVEVRKHINKKFDEIVEVLKKSKYADEEDVMRKFQLLRVKMQGSGNLRDLNELIDSIRNIIKEERTFKFASFIIIWARTFSDGLYLDNSDSDGRNHLAQIYS